MSTARKWMGWLLLPLSMLAVEASAEKGAVAFPTSAKVWINAEGVPARVEISPKVPEFARPLIEEQIRTWRFQSAKVNGVAQEGATYLSLQVCASQGSAGDLRMAVDYLGNGPGYPKGLPMLTPPRYPMEAAASNVGGTWFVEFAVETDGTTTVTSIYPEKKAQRKQKAFEKALREWMKDLQFMPEEIAGQSVRTHLRVPADFLIGTRDEDEKTVGDLFQSDKSAACAAVAGKEKVLSPLALDSPFKRIDTEG